MRHRYRNAIVAAVLTLAAGGLLTAVAAAETSGSSDAAMNHRILVDNENDNAVLPAGVFCPGFDVQLSLVRSKE